MTNYVVDTNYLVYAFDEATDKAKRVEYLKKLQQYLSQGDELFLTPLIRYEVLRNVALNDDARLKKLENALTSACKTLDISDQVADLARDLYRLDRLESVNNPDKNLDKRKFDMFHYATAKINGIDLLSADNKDMPKIDGLYQRLQLLKII